MRIMLIIAAMLATGLATPALAQDRTPITSCTPGVRVWAQAGEVWLPATLTGASPGAGQCYVLLDDHLRAGPQPAPMGSTTAVNGPAAPAARMLELGGIRELTPSQVGEMYAMAEQTHANARIYLTRYNLTVNDSTIVARLCNPDWQSAICQRANGQFHGSVAANNQVIDERNRKAEAEEREARAMRSSEPVNSGFYSSGTTSTPYKPSAGAAPGTPVQGVQSESTIRQNQARCRAGSGPC
ncbi:MAG: hypothetical protein V4574_08030 [Pseudomonadota bacterium]